MCGWRGIQGRQTDVEERHVGESNDIALFEFDTSGERDVPKTRRHREDRRPMKTYAGQKLNEPVSRDGWETSLAGQGDGEDSENPARGIPRLQVYNEKQ